MNHLRSASVVLSLLLLAGCSGPPLGERADARPAVPSIDRWEPGPNYCPAVQAMLLAQPSGAFVDGELRATLTTYADSVERVAEVSSPDAALVLYELAATARLVAAEPGNAAHAERLGRLTGPVAPIVIRASQVCRTSG